MSFFRGNTVGLNNGQKACNIFETPKRKQEAPYHFLDKIPKNLQRKILFKNQTKLKVISPPIHLPNSN
jgi:hypothetical protein